MVKSGIGNGKKKKEITKEYLLKGPYKVQSELFYLGVNIHPPQFR